MHIHSGQWGMTETNVFCFGGVYRNGYIAFNENLSFVKKSPPPVSEKIHPSLVKKRFLTTLLQSKTLIKSGQQLSH